MTEISNALIFYKKIKKKLLTVLQIVNSQHYLFTFSSLMQNIIQRRFFNYFDENKILFIGSVYLDTKNISILNIDEIDYFKNIIISKFKIFKNEIENENKNDNENKLKYKEDLKLKKIKNNKFFDENNSSEFENISRNDENFNSLNCNSINDEFNEYEKLIKTISINKNTFWLMYKEKLKY